VPAAGRTFFCHLLRIYKGLNAPLNRWADDILRNLNGQIEFLLREATTQAGRMKRAKKNTAKVTIEQRTRGVNDQRKRPCRA